MQTRHKRNILCTLLLLTYRYSNGSSKTSNPNIQSSNRALSDAEEESKIEVESARASENEGSATRRGFSLILSRLRKPSNVAADLTHDSGGDGQSEKELASYDDDNESIEVDTGVSPSTSLPATSASLAAPSSHNSLTRTTIIPSIIPIMKSIHSKVKSGPFNIPFRKIIHLSLTGIQLSICLYFCKAIYKSIIELIEEYDEFYEQHYGRGSISSSSGRNTHYQQTKQHEEEDCEEDHDGDESQYDDEEDEHYDNQHHQHEKHKQEGGEKNNLRSSSNLKNSWDAYWKTKQSNYNSKTKKSRLFRDEWKVEEHDLPFLNEDNVDHVLNDIITRTTAASSSSSNNRMRKTLTSRIPSSTTSNLILRLHSAGLPLYQPNKKSSTNDIQSILKSLTKTEGHLLSSSLLSPLDLQFENGSIGHPVDGGGGSSSGRNENNERIVQLWNEIGGLEDVKEGLLDVAFPLMAIFQQQQDEESNNIINQSKNTYNIHDPSYYGGLLSNPPGILLYGPPGTGKSMLARALAQTIHARFLTISPSSLLRKYVGETNLNVRALFALAKKIQPCVIFIDEIEGLFRERSGSGGDGSGGGGGGRGDEHEVNRELKTEFMQLWDGIQGSASNQNILIVGATNRPFDVDSAFLRRMPRSFFVGLPNFESRKSILEKMLANVPLLPGGFNIEEVAALTEGYTPSDMKEVLRTAALGPLREARVKVMEDHMKAVKEGKVPPSQFPSMGQLPALRPLCTIDLIEARQKVAPTQLSPHYRAALLEYASRATGGRVGIFGKSEEKMDLQHDMLDPYAPPSTADSQGFTYFSNVDPTRNGIDSSSFYEADSNIQEEDDTEYDNSSSYFDD